MATKRFLGLDGLRGVCALSVVFFHCNDFFHKGPFFQHGFLAVDVFFILSGFVIALTYEDRLRSGGGTFKFLFNRARRLFPTYWLGAGLNIALFTGIAVSGAALVASDSWWMIWLFIPVTTLLLIPDYVTPDGILYPPMGNVAWSLFAEWGAYLAYGFRLFRFKTSTLVVLTLSGWALMTFAGFHSGVGWCVGAERSTFLLGILRCVPAFAAGVVIYRLHRHRMFQRLPVISTEILLAVWLCITVIPTYTATPAIDPIIVVALSPMLICLLIRSEHKAPAFCGRMGELSYPLYVVHPGIILLATNTPVFGLSHGPRPLNALLVVGLCLALAWALMEIVARLKRARKLRASGKDAAYPRTYAILPGPERCRDVTSADTLQLD